MAHLTYLWLREDGTPYYVGKDSSGTRAFRKGSPSKDRVITQEWPSEDEAFIAEILLIAVYGRKDNATGMLRNHTDGGEGQLGRPGYWKGKKLLPETLRKLSVVRKGRKVSDETKAKHKKDMLGNKNSLGFKQAPESIQKRIDSLQKNLKPKNTPAAIRQRAYVARLKSEGPWPAPAISMSPEAIRQRACRARKKALK